MSDISSKKKDNPLYLVLAVVAVAGSASFLGYRYYTYKFGSVTGFSAYRPVARRSVPMVPNYMETEDGRRLLWAQGPRDLEKGEWFDVTESPLDPGGYQFGIGKDSIPAIDTPKFAAIDDSELLTQSGIGDHTIVIGYANNGVAKAYPVQILDRHELVNDTVGGKPVTVGW